MRNYIVILHKKIICLIALIAIVILPISIYLIGYLISLPVTFTDPQNGLVVIDPGHGGIDGGTNMAGIFEKDINLFIALKLRDFLENEGYKVIMTREQDTSLDRLDHSDVGRHKRDLRARVNIINNSNAQMFLSIHVNCFSKNPAANGSIVFYNAKYDQNKSLAYDIQQSLNNMVLNEKKRTVHNPQQTDFYILRNSKIPGVIIETAFLSNSEERQLLTKDEIKLQIAKAISDGAEKYLNEQNKMLAARK